MSVSQLFISRLFLRGHTSLLSTSLLFQQPSNLSFSTSSEEAEGANKKKRDPEKDRSEVIPVETSIRYLQSQAYKETYGETPVWVPYRRNFKGQFAPKATRKTCIRKQQLTTGNACPICRDEYLVLDYRNVELLKQFISPHNGELLGWDKTGLCRTQHFNLQVAMEKAKDFGTISFDVPFRDYSNYDYRKVLEQAEEQDQSEFDDDIEKSSKQKKF